MKTTIFSKTTIGALAVCSLLLSACRGDGGFDYDHSALYVSGTDENPVVKFVVEDTPASYAVTVQSTEKVASDVKLLMAIDRSKVAEYNEANKTNYFAIPEGAVELENPEVVISEGNAGFVGCHRPRAQHRAVRRGLHLHGACYHQGHQW